MDDLQKSFLMADSMSEIDAEIEEFFRCEETNDIVTKMSLREIYVELKKIGKGKMT